MSVKYLIFFWSALNWSPAYLIIPTFSNRNYIGPIFFTLMMIATKSKLLIIHSLTSPLKKII